MTESEILLESILELHGIKFGRIPKSRIPQQRTPDYIIDIDRKSSFWEVKELEPNDDEKYISNNYVSGVSNLYSLNSKRIRASIKSASEQFKNYGVADKPCVVVVYDARPFETKDILFYPSVLEAMFGHPEYQSDKKGKLKELSRTNTLFTRGGKTYISAVVVIHYKTKKAVFLHNPNAGVSLLETSLREKFKHHGVANYTQNGLIWEWV